MNNTIYIKEKNKGLFTKGLIYLSLIIFSLILAFLPIFIKKLSDNAIVFYFIGGILFLVFTILYVLLLVNEFKPKNFLILTSDGFYDLKNIGDNLKVEWTNVASVKILGKKETPYLGINFENCDILVANMKKKNADEIRENINEGLPHVLISQSEIRYSVKGLKETLVKFVRESRAVINETSKATKSNPFSTEDVLRAFGKLPPEEEHNSERIESNEQTSTVHSDMTQSGEIPLTERELNIVNDSNADNASQSDSFYSTLQVQLIGQSISNDINESPVSSQESEHSECEINKAENDTKVSDTNSDNELSDELKAILSLARSSKISEIEKMLSDNEAPFTFSRNSEVSQTSEDDSIQSNTTVEVMESYFNTLIENNPDVDQIDVNKSVVSDTEIENNDDINNSEIDEYKIELPTDLYQKDDSEIDLTLSSLFAKNNDAPTTTNEKDRKTDTIEFFPDLMLINDEGDTSSPPNDDDGFIIPDLSEYK